MKLISWIFRPMFHGSGLALVGCEAPIRDDRRRLWVCIAWVYVHCFVIHLFISRRFSLVVLRRSTCMGQVSFMVMLGTRSSAMGRAMSRLESVPPACFGSM